MILIDCYEGYIQSHHNSTEFYVRPASEHPSDRRLYLCVIQAARSCVETQEIAGKRQHLCVEAVYTR